MSASFSTVKLLLPPLQLISISWESTEYANSIPSFRFIHLLITSVWTLGFLLYLVEYESLQSLLIAMLKLPWVWLVEVCLVKAVVFPVVMYGCESWTIRKAEHRRTGAFELWCWRRLLRVIWTARRSNQSILKEISPEYSLEGLMLKLNCNTLATWYKELTRWKNP